MTVDARCGDLFRPIEKDERFDYIFWNHPWNYTEEVPTNMLLRAGFDYKYETLHRFFEEAHRYLSLGGKILLGTGSFARLEIIENLATGNRYSVQILDRLVNPLALQGGAVTEFLVYQFAHPDG